MKCLFRQERFDEVRRLCEAARETTGADDLINFVMLEGLEGGLIAHDGRCGAAEKHARRAVELAEPTDFYETRGWARFMLAETLALVGRPGEASAEAAAGLAHYDDKDDATGAARVRDRFEKLGIEVS